MKKKKMPLLARPLLSVLFAATCIPLTVHAQYYGIGNRKREAIDIDFNADHLAEEENKKETFVSAEKSIPTELIVQCERELSEPVVNVTLINDQGHVLYNDKGLIELSGNSGRFKKQGETTYTFSKTFAKNTYSYSINSQAVHGERYSCLSPRVDIEIKQERQETEIASEIKPKSCLESSVLNHEMRRIKHNNQIAKEIQTVSKQKVEQKLLELGIIYGDETRLKSWLSNVVNDTIEPIIKKTEKDLTSAYTDLDSLQDSDYFIYVCEGQGLDIIEVVESKK